MDKKWVKLVEKLIEMGWTPIDVASVISHDLIEYAERNSRTVDEFIEMRKTGDDLAEFAKTLR